MENNNPKQEVITTVVTEPIMQVTETRTEGRQARGGRRGLAERSGGHLDKGVLSIRWPMLGNLSSLRRRLIHKEAYAIL